MLCNEVVCAHDHTWFRFEACDDSSDLVENTLPSCNLLHFSRRAAEIKKQREFYQKLGMEVPGDIKGELCNMKTHLDQRNGTFHRTHTAHTGRFGHRLHPSLSVLSSEYVFGQENVTLPSL